MMEDNFYQQHIDKRKVKTHTHTECTVMGVFFFVQSADFPITLIRLFCDQAHHIFAFS